MDTEVNDSELVARLKRLDAGAAGTTPGFDYEGMLQRRATRDARARRRLVLARGAALGLLVALLGASFWRLDDRSMKAGGVQEMVENTPAPRTHEGEPRIVRADTYL